MAYERGQEVFRSRPFCHMIEFSYRAKICDFCLKFNPEANTKCVDCRFVHYCNKLCQKMAWASYHQQECKYFKKLPCENKTISSPTIGKNIFQKIFDIFHLQPSKVDFFSDLELLRNETKFFSPSTFEIELLLGQDFIS